jgi:hypothetical protein
MHIPMPNVPAKSYDTFCALRQNNQVGHTQTLVVFFSYWNLNENYNQPVNGTELSAQEFRDGLLLRHARGPPDLPPFCEWEKPHSEVCGHVNARMGVAIVRATHPCIRGSRVPTGKMCNASRSVGGQGRSRPVPTLNHQCSRPVSPCISSATTGS